MTEHVLVPAIYRTSISLSLSSSHERANLLFLRRIDFARTYGSRESLKIRKRRDQVFLLDFGRSVGRSDRVFRENNSNGTSTGATSNRQHRQLDDPESKNTTQRISSARETTTGRKKREAIIKHFLRCNFLFPSTLSRRSIIIARTCLALPPLSFYHERQLFQDD